MSYKNFDVAVYCPVGNLNAIGDLHKFEKSFRFIEKHIHIDKVYLETYRSNEFIDREKILRIKEFFESRGIRTSGGITTTDGHRREGFGFDTLCYTNSLHRERIKSVVEMTASIFDEIILDDFFFTNCKCDSCIEARGDMSWSEFKLRLMKEVSEELIVKPAKRVNPKVNMIVKFPNWYEYFQETGYNLEDKPRIFDMIYTGTETRDPLYTQQHLPRYLSYFIMRYMENIKPGKNGGGWFDTFECRGNLNYYVEQANLTLFSKPREVTLFCLGLLLDRRWSIFTPLAGYALETADEFLGKLGNPVGTACYIPYHSTGEEYLHDYLGMIGIPLEPYPQYPEGSGKVFLAESAAKDPFIAEKMEKSLRSGKDVIITSGLVRALSGKGLERLANISLSDRKALVDKYGISKAGINFDGMAISGKPVLLPWMNVATNDVWQLAFGLGENNNVPLAAAASYGKGRLYAIAIPDDYGNLYNLPREVLNVIRSIFREGAPVTLDAGAKIGLFTYDNDTFIVESFLPCPYNFELSVGKPDAVLLDLVSGEELHGIAADGAAKFKVDLQPASYKVFKIK